MEVISRAEALASGRTHYFTGKPCKRGHIAKRFVTSHGCAECRGEWELKNPLYNTWNGMIHRCYDENHLQYCNYGGRGISVCEAWLDSETGYETFLRDMGKRPEGHTLDRIDPDGNYEPTNCRWVDWDTQCRNKTNTKVKGEDIGLIMGLRAEGLMNKQIAPMFNCKPNNISAIVVRNRRAA